jgi:hypothetical protein
MSKTKKDLKSHKKDAIKRKMKPYILNTEKLNDVINTDFNNISMENYREAGYSAAYVKRWRKKEQYARQDEKQRARTQLKRELKQILKDVE